jgi:Helix-turn-helix
VANPGAADGEQVEILPLTVVARSFAARPSSLPDVRDFVRRQLTGTPVTDDDVRRLCDRVAEVLLEAAGLSGSIQVSLRLFPESAEVDVLFAAARTAGAGLAVSITPSATGPAQNRSALNGPTQNGPALNGPALNGRAPYGGLAGAEAIDPDETVGPGLPVSFAAWFAARLRREGLTMEAAARRLDVSAKTISRWVAGSTEPRLRDLLRIRDIFGEPPIH